MRIAQTLNIIVLILVQTSTYGQDKVVRSSIKGLTIQQALEKIEQELGVSFFYESADTFLKQQVKKEIKNKDLNEALKIMLDGTGYKYTCVDKYVAISKITQTIESNHSTSPYLITGTVTNSEGEAIFGVNVYEDKNPTKGVITHSDGSFSLIVEDKTVELCFSFIGYEQAKGTFSIGDSINVILKRNNQFLPEIVVIGYGAILKTDVTGAISQITANELGHSSLYQLSKVLQGVAANLIVQQTNSEPGAIGNINIRGISTIKNNSPLVVIDGVPGGDLNLINPNDIESISILKDAGSAAIYGSRSANGVVLISTKKGTKKNDISVEFTSQIGILSPDILFEPVGGMQNAMLRNSASLNAGNSGIFGIEELQKMDDLGDNEWIFKSITKNCLRQNHNINVSGGGEHTSYNLSLGYFDEESVFVGPNYGTNRLNFRTGLSSEYGRLKFSTNLAYTLSNISTHTFSSDFLIADASRTPVDYRYKLKDRNGRYLVNDVLSQFNPLGILEQGGVRNSDNDNFLINLNAEFEIFSGFKVKGIIGADVKANHTKNLTNKVLFYSNASALKASGVYGADLNADDINEKIRFNNSQLILDYSKQTNKHEYMALLGVSNESFKRELQSVYMRYTDPVLHLPTSGTVVSKYSLITPQTLAEHSLSSLFGRIGYSYNNKYLFKANFRYDGTSRFEKHYRWGFFPSASVGWRISDENFWKPIDKYCNAFKLRASYGLLGNQNVMDYIYYDSYILYKNAYGFNNEEVDGAVFQQGNSEIDWEVSRNLNLGVDIGLLDGDLNFNIDVYNTLTNNIILSPVVPGTYGGNVSDYNLGKMQNNGWELTVNYRLKKGKATHNLSLNIADAKNEVISFGGQRRIETFDEMQRITMKGLPLNSYFGYKIDGYFQNKEEVEKGAKPIGAVVFPGDIRFKDKNNDGVINDQDRYVLGNAFPRYTFGINYKLQWRNFDANVRINGVGKREMFLRGELVEPFHGAYSYTMYKHQLDYWSPKNRNARFPRLTTHGSSSSVNNYGNSSDFYIFNAAYLRLKSLQVGYTLPKKISGKVGIKKARLFFDAQNVFTISSLSFINPEITEFDNNMNGSRANSGRNYPTPKYFGLGLDITF